MANRKGSMPVSGIEIAAFIVGIGLIAFLFYALLYPEKL
jgi:K+-transporting ATPase KdpF subunit